MHTWPGEPLGIHGGALLHGRVSHVQVPRAFPKVLKKAMPLSTLSPALVTLRRLPGRKLQACYCGVYDWRFYPASFSLLYLTLLSLAEPDVCSSHRLHFSWKPSSSRT